MKHPSFLSSLATRLSAFGAIIVILSACGEPSTGMVPTSTVPTPTVASMFEIAPTLTPRNSRPTPTVAPVDPADATALAAPSATPRPQQEIGEELVFGDKLSSDWSLAHSQGVNVNGVNKTVVYTGTTAIAITPREAWGQIFFTLNKDSQHKYPRERVVGLSFQLSGGKNWIDTDSLAVAVVGSNKYNYWVANDTSVSFDQPLPPDTPLFDETRLYFMEVNNAIPPGQWVEATLWFDIRQDPDYSYLTGFYIKNDQSFKDTFYIDQVKLLTLQDKS